MHIAIAVAAALAIMWSPVRAQTAPGEVVGSQLVTEGIGGLNVDLKADDNFGRSIARLGDLDGNGDVEIAVGAPNDNDGAPDAGAVWILSVRPNGGVVVRSKISGTTPGLVGKLAFDVHFGFSVAAAGDLDGDGTPDLFVGAPGDDEIVSSGGAVWAALLNPDGSLKEAIKLDLAGTPGLPPLVAFASLGVAVGAIGDLDGDGIPELAVGGPGDGPNTGDSVGAVFVVFLDAALTVTSVKRLGGTAGELPFPLAMFDGFASALTTPGDLDGDDVPDLIVGGNDGAVAGRGAVYVLSLDTDGSVKSHTRIAPDGTAGFTAELGVFDLFAESMAVIGDVDHDGVVDLAVGAPLATGGLGVNDGAVFILFMRADGTVKSHTKIAPGGIGGFGDTSGASERFGGALAPLGDIDGDGVLNVAIGMHAYPSVLKVPGFWGSFHSVRLTDGQWVQLDTTPGIGGVSGIPEITGVGVPLPAEQVTIRVNDAASQASIFFVVGFTVSDLPLKGGVLVPTPDIFVALTTDATGGARLGATWPNAVPVGQAFFFQSWVLDAAAPAGWSSTPALQVTTP